jgi:hypothetical protein
MDGPWHKEISQAKHNMSGWDAGAGLNLVSAKRKGGESAEKSAELRF